MIRSNISRIAPFFFLARRITTLPRTPKERNSLNSTIIYEEEEKTNNFETEIKRVMPQKKEELPKRIYYKFLCKCGSGFNSFSEFLEHIKSAHQIKKLDFTEIFAKSRKKDWAIKFYWHLSCQCGHKFVSSLCNADLKISERQIEILKKYHLRCLKCKQNAKFDNEELLDEFLKERVKQKLIYSFYKEKFAQFKNESHSERILEGHIQELCEKCQLLGRYCGEELIQQEQISQINYIPPFLKW